MDLSSLSKNDFSIIDFMYRNGLISKTCSSTLQKISNGIKESREDQTGVSIPKMRIAMKMFSSMGIVLEGARDVRSKTYYLSEKGIEVAEDIRRDVEESLKIINKTKCVKKKEEN
ncbi:TPA: hypothetical protein ACF2DD_002047 [Clostridium perfringens]|nr:hypothetical protein [Clostridium perfringens]